MARRNERENVAHLLRRFGLGASEAEIDYYGAQGLSGAIDKLLAYDQIEEGFDLRLEELANERGNIQMRLLQTWWLTRMVMTRRPLQEKLVLFWHDHFATSAAKVDVVASMHEQNQTLRKHSIGRFQDLLLAVSKDPAMVYWLDNNTNVKGKANENFARELLELFTLGIGHYTERDVRELARCFTGWSFGVGPRRSPRPKPGRLAQFVFRPQDYDDGVKTFLGNSGHFNGEDAIAILCDHPRTALFIAEKMWAWFAYPDPEPHVIDRIVERFRSSGLDVKTLVRAIMESPEFYSDRAFRRVVKNPIDFTIATMRQLGLGARLRESLAAADRKTRALLPMFVAQRAAKAMGMDVFYPPDVAGWETGPNWISTATMVERVKWADALFGPPTTATARTPNRSAPSLRLPAAGLLAGKSPAEATHALVSIFDAGLGAEKLAQLVQVASKVTGGGPVSAVTANRVAREVCQLTFAAPEFQFC
jgi:uncharacterized protein (DUF1800 family)